MEANVYKQTHLYNRFALDVGHPVGPCGNQACFQLVVYATTAVGTLTTALDALRKNPVS